MYSLTKWVANDSSRYRPAAVAGQFLQAAAEPLLIEACSVSLRIAIAPSSNKTLYEITFVCQLGKYVGKRAELELIYVITRGPRQRTHRTTEQIGSKFLLLFAPLQATAHSLPTFSHCQQNSCELLALPRYPSLTIGHCCQISATKVINGFLHELMTSFARL
jgi:hypothetical protein